MRFDGLSNAVGERVQWYRERAQLTRQQLADRCTEIASGGDHLTFAAITSIETGRRDPSGRRRRSITVDEVVILARALRIPPIVLIFPVTKDDPVVFMPGKTAHPFAAVQWFAGEAPVPETTFLNEWDNPYGRGDYDSSTELWDFYEEPEEWSQRAPGRPSGTALDLWRQHHRAFLAWWASRERSMAARRGMADAQSESTKAARAIEADAEDSYREQVIERDLVRARSELRDIGMTPFALPEEMQHLDAVGGGRT